MRENHPIDDLFREVVLPCELTPSDNVWNSLDKKLQAKANPGKSHKINKTLLTSVAIIGSLAALLVGYYFASHENNQAKKIIATSTIPTLNPTSIVKTDNVSAKNEIEAVTKEHTSASVKTNFPDFLVNKNTSSENVQTVSNEFDNSIFNSRSPLLIDGFDKTEPEPFVAVDKKNNSDKAILLMPYFPSDYSSNQTDNQTEGKSANKNETGETLNNKAEKAESTVYVPNAFTPNGDGLNDVFIPQTAENIKEYKMFIYDKTGNLVFSSDDIHKGWEGHSQNNGAESIKADIYLWRIELKNNKGEREHLMGYVNLLNDK